ncbi:hypothetical protein BC829DRAFT_285201 [Chytridium lagenaria]|nr:hypothetical protein BC829DRAFT_285201 [Chytridium lagenaria]
MTSIRTSKKFINVRRLTALPSQLKLEPHVRQEILDDISTRSDTPLSPTPSQSTCLSRTCNSHSSTSPPPSPSFDYIDFQRHDPSLRDGWLLENKFRKEDLMRRENKWRTVDRHSGASTQLVVFQCKCGIPPKAPSAVFGKMGRHMGGVRTYPYLSCKAFVHMTCDSQGLPLVVRGFFSHTHACAKTTTLSPLRFNIDPFFENLAVSQLERNQPMRVILAENARRVRELSHDRVKEMTDNGTRALLCRSDVRNLRRALLRKRPELKRVHGEGSKNREFGQSKLGKVIGGGVTKNRKSARSAFVGEDDEDDSSSDEDGDRFCRHSSSTPATTNAEFESVITAGVTQKSGAPPMTFQDRFGADTAQIRQLAPPSVPAHSSGSPPHAPFHHLTHRPHIFMTTTESRLGGLLSSSTSLISFANS